MGVPILVGTSVTGVVAVQDWPQNRYTEGDVRLLSTLAASMGVALENAWLFEETSRLLEETQQRNAELAVINRVQQGLAKQLDFQAVIDLVGDKIQEIFDAQVVSINLYDRGTNLLDGSAPFYRSYTCRDGRFVAVGALEDVFYDRFVRGLGLEPDDLPDRWDRAHWPQLAERFAGILCTRDRDAWTETFHGLDACLSPVLTLDEATTTGSGRVLEIPI